MKQYHLSVKGVLKGYHFSISVKNGIQKGKGLDLGVDYIMWLLHTSATLISFLQENNFFPGVLGWA